MEHWLEHVPEPQRLLLAWQAPLPDADRFRWAVGEVSRAGTEATLRYFAPGPEFSRYNQERTYEQLEALGYFGHPAFRRGERVHGAGVIEVFRRRLPPSKRSDFATYKRHFRLPPHLALSDFALLGLTEARLPSDGFSLVNPLDGSIANCDLMIEVAGFRHYSGDFGRPIRVGEPVLVAPEPANPHDPDAVMLRIDETKIGNINRLQAQAFSEWLRQQSVAAWVERLNGKQDHPRLFVFVRVRPRLSVAA